VDPEPPELSLGRAHDRASPTKGRKSPREVSEKNRLREGLPREETDAMKTLSKLLPLALLLAGCSSPLTNRDPVGEPFPSVRGESLEGTALELPEELAGAPAVLIVGYLQDAQFDADRWLFGLLQSETTLRILEVPAVRGWVPRLISGKIDQGMRDGIPPEDWASVVTVYGDADKVAQFTGTELGNNVRVFLLDSSGRVVWFHDRGYSAGVLLEMLEVARPLIAARDL
jgi:hypothetical protein